MRTGEKMEKTAIVTDSVSCINPELASKFDIAVVPTASIISGGEVYLEYKSLTMKEAYRMIRADGFSTSAVTPGEVLSVFKEIREKTSKILFVSLSSKLSAVFKSACAAAELLRDSAAGTDVRVIDTRNAAGGEGLIAVTAARASAEGKSIDQIEKIVRQAMEVTGGFATVDTLRYVYRTGRISKFSARMISLFNVKSINRITPEGELVLVDKAFSRKACIQKAVSHIRQAVKDVPHRFMINHADAPEIADYFIGLIKHEFKVIDDILVSDFSPIMGHATGPGAAFVGYQPEIDFDV
jgi:DegV family protein with EDD domain